MSGSKITDRPDTPSILAPPPFIFLGALALGLILQALRPRPLFVHALALRITGGSLLLGGLALSGAVVRHFRQVGTPVSLRRPSRHLVVSGPYRFSRNPDYLGQALAVAGLAFLLNAAWVCLAVLPALLLVRYGVIAREEQYLDHRFGEEYRRYRRHVRRWL
jgi:protein-S-isoprenylcysteine O-methyltransferase Ste14